MAFISNRTVSGTGQLSVTCISRNPEIEPLIKKFASWGDVSISLRFMRKYEEFDPSCKRRGDVLVADVCTSEFETAFFARLRSDDFRDMLIIVLCVGTAAQEWHSFVLDKEIVDYLVVRPLYDANRLKVQLKNLLELSSLIQMFERASSSDEGKTRVQFLQQMSSSPFSLVREVAEYSRHMPDFISTLESVNQEVSSLQIRTERPRDTRVNDPIPNESEASRSSAFHSRALLIEKNEPDAHLTQRVLESLGYLVTRVESVRGAVLSQKGRTFNLVLLDILATGKGGTQALNWIRNELPLHSVPILITSNVAEETEVKGYAELGIAGFLVKPIKATRLEAKLQKLRKGRDQTAGART